MPYKDPEKRKAYQKEYWKKYSQKNRKKLNQKAKERRNEIKDWLQEYKQDLFCDRCGETENHCLDFHHIGEKFKSINEMMNDAYSKERILEEIEKCIVICGNCHRIEHLKDVKRKKFTAKEFNNLIAAAQRKKKILYWYDGIKSKDVCYICGYTNHLAIEYHHILPKFKGINHLIRNSYLQETIIEEFKKCIPVCVNCHRKIHNDIVKINVSKKDLEDLWNGKF